MDNDDLLDGRWIILNMYLVSSHGDFLREIAKEAHENATSFAKRFSAGSKPIFEKRKGKRGGEQEIIPQVVALAGRSFLWLANHDKTVESGEKNDGGCLCAFSCLLLHNLFEVNAVAVRGGASYIAKRATRNFNLNSL